MGNLERNKIYKGHVLEVLKTFPDESIDMIMTSPPYFGLRNYGEETKTIWDGDPNCQHEWQTKDRYLHRGSTKTTIHAAIQRGGLKVEWKTRDDTCQKCGAWFGQLGLEPTLDLYLNHLLQITAELKRVLKKTGTLWWVHGDSYNGTGVNRKIGEQREIYKKYNAELRANDDGVNLAGMPKKCLLLQPYRLAQMMIEQQDWRLRNILIWYKPNVMPSSVKDRFTNDFEPVLFFSKSKKYWFETQLEPADYDGRKDTIMKKSGKYESGNYMYNANAHSVHSRGHERWPSQVDGKRMRNKRAVWKIPTKPFKEAHFAVFPPALCVTPIKAGCPPGGVVLDPFFGSGTVAQVARELGRDWIGIEISQKYIKMAEDKLRQNVLF